VNAGRRAERRRPPFPLRIGDALGRALERLGWSYATLDEQALCAAACRKTRLSDFGDERFRPLFRQRIRDLQNLFEQLDFVGRLVARVLFVRTLRNRLLIQQRITEHPEILQVRVSRPLVIAGLARTGTSLLVNLLAQDPGSRPLLLGEALAPASLQLPVGAGGDPRLRRAARFVWLLNHVAPGLRSIHILEPQAPIVECIRLFHNTFLARLTTSRDMQQVREAFSPETLAWAYRDYYRQLQLLEWQRPAPDHWLLKWPQHLYALDTLVKTVPDVAIVQTHRDPAQVIPAICQLVGRFGVFLSNQRWKEQPRHVVALCEEILRRALEARQHIPPGRVSLHRCVRPTSADVARAAPRTEPRRALLRSRAVRPGSRQRPAVARLLLQAVRGRAEWLSASPFVHARRGAHARLSSRHHPD